jgi:hypothetical protein
VRNFSFPAEASIHDFQACFALLLINRAGANVEGCAAAGMPDEFLSNLEVHTERRQIRRQRMTEAVPADLFPTTPIFARAGRTLFSRFWATLPMISFF